MEPIEAVMVLALLALGLVVAWNKGYLQTSEQLRRRATDWLSKADAKDFYDQKLISAKTHWQQAAGLNLVDHKKALQLQDAHDD